MNNGKCEPIKACSKERNNIQPSIPEVVADKKMLLTKKRSLQYFSLGFVDVMKNFIDLITSQSDDKRLGKNRRKCIGNNSQSNFTGNASRIYYTHLHNSVMNVSDNSLTLNDGYDRKF